MIVFSRIKLRKYIFRKFLYVEKSTIKIKYDFFFKALRK